jgi:putative ABC transport system permease protein
MLHRAKSWLLDVFHRSHAERDMDTELRFHLDAYTEDLVRAGVPREEAQRRARLEFGGLEQAKERCRDATGSNLLESVLLDVRYALRLLRKAPVFTAAAVITLALGIGADTAVFSVVDAVLLRPLAMEDPSHVVYLQEHWKELFPGFSVGNFADVRRQSSSFANLCASNDGNFNLATADTPERLEGEMVTASYFSTFGVQPIAGRVFSSDEDIPGRSQVTVISERLWRTRFDSNPSIVGQVLHLNGLSYTVVGIMPKSFDPLLENSDIWVPAAYTPQQLADHDDHYLSVIGRLNPGVSLAAAQSELDVIAERLQRQYPMDDKERTFHATLLSTALLGDQQLALRMFLAAGAFLLLIACANIANLQLARGQTRRKEMAMRAAIGASAKRIVGQLLIENAVLGLAGGLVGVLLAYFGVSWIVANGPVDVPRLTQSSVNGKSLAFACGVALCSSFLFGLAPALRSASTRLSEAFKEAAGASMSSRDRVRNSLVIAEIALALILMTAAGLLVRNALLVAHQDPGFDSGNLIVGRVALSDPGYHDPLVARQTFEHLVEASAALPGAQSAAVVSRAPLAGGGGSNGLVPEGKSLDLSNTLNARLQIVSPGYLSTLRVPLKAGRDFTQHDTRDKVLVTIVNEALARAMWRGENPIGKRFACCEEGPKGREDPVWHEVVGVVGDIRARGLDRDIQPEFYLPLAQMPTNSWDWLGRTMDLVVRARDTSLAPTALRRTVATIAPGVPVYQLSSMQQKIAATQRTSRFDTFLLALFALIALSLSSVGIYGVLSYVVAQRTRDIGLRMALGATQSQIARDVLGSGFRLIATGLLIGLCGACISGRLVASLLYGVRPTDAAAYAVAALTLAAVAFLASYIPARRAMRVDPIVALRYE